MRRLQLLNETSRVLSSTLDLRTLYDTIYQQISRVMDASMFSLTLVSRDGHATYLPYLQEFGQLSLDVPGPAGMSITRFVIDHGLTLYFHNQAEYELFAEDNDLPVITVGDTNLQGCEAIIIAPLSTGSRTIGALSVESPQSNAYSQDDVDTLAVIASQAAIAIENARLYEASVAATQRFQTLLRVAQTVNSSLELPAVLEAVLEGISEVMPYYTASILLPDYEHGDLETVKSAGKAPSAKTRAARVPFGHGVTGCVFETGAAPVIPDVREHNAYVPMASEVRSEIAVPLSHGDVVIGVLNVERTEMNGFTDEDRDLLTLFASQVAIAIQNARLFDAQRRRVLEQQTIQTFVQELTSVHDATSIAGIVDEQLRALVDFDFCCLFVFSPDGRLMPITSNPELTSKVPWLANDEGVAGHVVQTGAPVIVHDTTDDSRVSKRTCCVRKAYSVVAAPLKYEGQVIGVIILSREGRNRFDDTALNLLTIVGGQTAIALDRCRLYEELRVQAVTDELTGLFNRRYLDGRLDAEQSRAARNGHALSVLMMDLDDFKGVNDAYGHDCGDEVLREIARLLRRTVRTEDVVARYGGEEFCIILPEIGIDQAVAAAERIRKSIAETTLPVAQGEASVRASIGVSGLRAGDTETTLVTRADHAMYDAKRMGGNQVRVDPKCALARTGSTIFHDS
jgi:diguanylate cyclase (GGDEF)-like protein